MRLKALFSLFSLLLFTLAACQDSASITSSTEIPITEEIELIEATSEPIEQTTIEPTPEQSIEPTVEPTAVEEPEVEVNTLTPSESDPASTPTEEATIIVRFVESAPKDTFFIENVSDCTLGETTVTIDLAPSAGKLIFDTTESGAGVEVFQPFEITEGQMELIERDRVNDGDAELTLLLSNLLPQSRVGFTIDVDDTLAESDLGNIRVSGSEISGAVIRISGAESQTAEAEFGVNSQATATLACDATTS